jgi:uncharacterized protein (TIGR01777 family)
MGASGLIGTALVARELRAGLRVTAFSRTQHKNSPGMGYWNPDAGEIERERLDGADAVINLAGENLAAGRWTAARKRRLWDSRVHSTALLAKTLTELERPPHVWVNASAVGYYGNRPDDAIYEEDAPGTGFLAELCQAWEAATAPAQAAGIRVVWMRFAPVLTPQGGALAKMLPLFRLGAGGRLGSGEQPMPWIALADAVGAARFAARHPDVSGPVNAVAPEAITNEQFTEALGNVLSRPTVLPVPAFALKAVVGAELAQQALLTGANVRPRKLEVAGYRFEYPRIDDALEAMLRPH